MRKLVFAGVCVALLDHLINAAEGAENQWLEMSPNEYYTDTFTSDDGNLKPGGLKDAGTLSYFAWETPESTTGREDGQDPTGQEQEVGVAMKQFVGNEALTADPTKTENPAIEEHVKYSTEMKGQMREVIKAGTRLFKAFVFFVLFSAVESLIWRHELLGISREDLVRAATGNVYKEAVEHTEDVQVKRLEENSVLLPLLILALLFFYVRINLFIKALSFARSLAPVAAWHFKQKFLSKPEPEQVPAAEAAGK